MPAVTVVLPFYDLKAHRGREAGETFEVDADRAAEIESRLPGYVTVAGDAVPDLSGMTVPQLRALASERGVDIPKGIRKAEIIELLRG